MYKFISSASLMQRIKKKQLLTAKCLLLVGCVSASCATYARDINVNGKPENGTVVGSLLMERGYIKVFSVYPDTTFKYFVVNVNDIVHKIGQYSYEHTGLTLKVRAGQTAYIHDESGAVVDSCTVGDTGQCIIPYTKPIKPQHYYLNFAKSTNTTVHESIGVDVIVTDNTQLPTKKEVVVMGGGLIAALLVLIRTLMDLNGRNAQDLKWGMV